ncbi:MAG TPA: amidohydrolase family protein, partial [Thermoanaerobaculia bacterium]|nr:amidohydrolase family protein [Thermoanaerobaculia bacterium]
MRRIHSALVLSLLLSGSALAQGPGPVTIRAGRLLDGRGGAREDVTVTIEGSRIVRVEKMEAGGTAKPTWDLRGLTLMPGGVDTHVHIGWHFDRNGKTHDDGRPEPPAQTALYAAENAQQTLAGGITTVQSLGAPEDKDLRDWIARGTLLGPRVLTSLEPLEDPKLTPEQIRRIVRERAAQGADVIKIFASKSIRD